MLHPASCYRCPLIVTTLWPVLIVCYVVGKAWAWSRCPGVACIAAVRLHTRPDTLPGLLVLASSTAKIAWSKD